ncbi:SMP-30/gluconolactonase/LRE family protein [Aggregatimonas sangjinii]|nr:SMP-30/gluconolactonase/LRE family protein [Aggregatimonas sangjinii]
MTLNLKITFIPLVALLMSSAACQSQHSDIIAEGAELVLVADDYTFTEGPAVDAEGNVFFTDQPNNRILKWSPDEGVSVFMQPSGRANGLYFDHEGNLLACADEKFQLWRIDSDKNVTVLWEQFEGLDLNGPNDLWVDPNGGIYFTDPYYQRPYWERSESAMKKEQVYYISPDMGNIKVVIDDFARPNGIIGSADGKTLFVSDRGNNKTYSYEILEDGMLSEGTLFCELGSDGMTIDNQGNVYLTGDGVTVFDKNGKQIEHIPTGKKWTANVTFGGPNQDLLFITAMDSVFTLQMNVKGVRN